MFNRMTSQARALCAYRNVARAINASFQGDLRTLFAARQRLRKEMELEKSEEHPEMSLEQRIDLMNQVATFLRRNIVQGVKTKEDRYELRITKDSELGDNEDIRSKKKTLTAGAVAGGGCCGQGTVPLKEKASK